MEDNEKAFWDWFQIGVDNDWLTPPFCNTHDGGYEYQTDEERQQWEEGGDPCMTVTRIKFLE